ncbi:MAG: ABC transporter ATP-binding protein, partial [Symbiobacteriaceae bacterium]|nr:ABC transporter ATP-binding protein [Symbiobacteriaceae bacterium]
MSIIIDDLSFAYDTASVFEGVNLEIQRGEVLAILGPNGAGKTTLLNLIAGLAAPLRGTISFDGQPQSSMTPRQLALLVGYVPQTVVPAFDYSVIDYVVTGCAPSLGTFERPGKEHFQRAEEAITAMGISHLREKSYRQISGGERQQVSIARVIAQRPAFILMDEPTAHLDYGNQIHVLQIIVNLVEEGFSVVFTTHNPDHVLLLGRRVAVIDRQGRLQAGDCSEVISAASLSALYGTDLRMLRPADSDRNI